MASPTEDYLTEKQKNMRLRLLTAAMTLMACAATMAQKNVYVVKTDSTFDTYAVDKVSHMAEAGQDAEGRRTMIVEMTDGTQNGYATDSIDRITLWNPEYVDLGGSVLWAKTNIGAASEGEAGSYFAWADTAEQANKRYGWVSYKYCHSDGVAADKYWANLTKYTTDSETKPKKHANNNGQSYSGEYDNKMTLDPEDDIAYVTTGGEARTPSPDELKELFDLCDVTEEEVEISGKGTVKGLRFTGRGRHAGASIFIPAGGYWHDNKLCSPDKVFLWSNKTSKDTDSAAYGIIEGYPENDGTTLDDLKAAGVSSKYHDELGAERNFGLPVRAVIAK